ncbi:sugar kinase [Vibrio rumoiensis]|uniref:2-dehydro-3-deoxygluconokinase n=1 Tax=Vibrio rumoiensis 1S-45 TaxID=1188252 RepID=A0A1E5E4F6_9VIBR|nr:sugar kinase [Vibrio rumoiensis]OEF27553.1 2-dehydro-3-deoxygluconokinase [Vibrio rumoiensis 1S-45]
MKIAFFGECMVELSGYPLQRTFGGDTLNTALYLARLGQSREIDVYYATALGTDSLSQSMLETWQSEDICTDLVTHFEDKMPGLYLVENDDNGERHFNYWRSDSAVKQYFERGLSPLETAINNHALDVIYISGISLAILSDDSKQRLVALLTLHKQQGGKVVFDNNYRAQLWSTELARNWYSKILPLVDIALITEDDDFLVWGEGQSVLERCIEMGCQEVAIKRGCEPCEVVTGLQTGKLEASLVSAEKVKKVVDTCAAGDSFAAGYLAGRLSGNSAAQSATLGHQLASKVIQHAGAIMPISAMQQLL